MASIPPLDLRPLREPLTAEHRSAARRWRRATRRPADVRAIGAAVAGWVMLLPGLVIVLAALARPEELAMLIVGSVMTAIGLALLVGRSVGRRSKRRREVRLLAFAEANGFAYAAAALLPGGRLEDALRAHDGADWGVLAVPQPDRTERRHGCIEVPYASPGDPAEDPTLLVLRDHIAEVGIPCRLVLRDGRLSLIAHDGWSQEDPAVQRFVHDVRSILATMARQSAASVERPTAIDSTDAGRQRARAQLRVGAGAVVGAVLIAVGTSLLGRLLA
ncbi:hypothetical protein AA0Z99_07235 [Agrococcus sp. 1P02AA]|uniref:hypothetical protein n=1 Tax=Agrococcus sp. 1P02AA TaxID=3132259 RepID=UPI0039A4D8A2